MRCAPRSACLTLANQAMAKDHEQAIKERDYARQQREAFRSRLIKLKEGVRSTLEAD